MLAYCLCMTWLKTMKGVAVFLLLSTLVVAVYTRPTMVNPARLNAEGPQPEDAAGHDVVPMECCDSFLCELDLCPPFTPCC